jgi:mRNA interferase HigB
MQIVALRTLKQFWARHRQAEGPIRAWFVLVKHAQWTSPTDVKRMFGSRVDFIADNRLIFDLAGNKYRVVVHVAYRYQRVLIKFVGTHAEYDQIDPETIR